MAQYVFPESRIVEVPLSPVSNISGSYSNITNDSRVTSDMKCVLLEIGDASVFKSKINITAGNGTVTLLCDDVSGETTVVASFIRADVRSFTVSFIRDEEDGGGVLEAKTLPFRSTPEYTGETPTTTKDNYYIFDGWNPAIAPVSGDNVYKAKFFNLLVARYLGSGLTTYESNTDTAIGSGAFYGMTGLTSVKSTATTVGANAFGGCTSLETIDLTSPTGAISLNATGIPESVTSIFIRSNTVGTLTGTLPSQFTEGSGIIYVHDDLLSDYETAWSTYASHIYPMNAYPVSATTTDTIKDSNEAFFRYLNDGTAQTRYDIGDTKTLNLGSEGNVQFVIAAKNADELADGSGNAALSIICMTAPRTAHAMNKTATTAGGWADSEIRTYLNETIWPLLPEALKTNIKTVKKYSDVIDSSGTRIGDVLTEDKIWLLSKREVFYNTQGIYYERTGPIYDMFVTDVSYRAKTNRWWLRSATSKWNFSYVETNGSISVNSANTSLDVIFGFCV